MKTLEELETLEKRKNEMQLKQEQIQQEIVGKLFQNFEQSWREKYSKLENEMIKNLNQVEQKSTSLMKLTENMELEAQTIKSNMNNLVLKMNQTDKWYMRLQGILSGLILGITIMLIIMYLLKEPKIIGTEELEYPDGTMVKVWITKKQIIDNE